MHYLIRSVNMFVECAVLVALMIASAPILLMGIAIVLAGEW